MLNVLIALFEKPLTKARETERKVLTRILCNPALNFARPIFDFEEVLHLNAMARLRPDLVQPVIWEAIGIDSQKLENRGAYRRCIFLW